MDLSKKLLTLLAIFCVIASAGIACAADASGDVYDSTYLGAADDFGGVGDHPDFDDEYDYGGYAGSQYNASEEPSGYAGSQYQDDGGWAGSQYNETLENANATGNATAQLAAGEPNNATSNMTANATSSHTMLATGNPILLLLGVTSVLGGAAVLRRK